MQISFSEAKKLRDKFKDKKIIVSGGVFDILHEGHIQYLNNIKEKDSILLIVLPRDEYIKSRKGPDRPILKERTRLAVVGNMKQVDFITLASKQDGELPPLVSSVLEIKPDIFYIGSDSEERLKEYFPRIKSAGIKVKISKIKKINSSTDIIRKIRS